MIEKIDIIIKSWNAVEYTLLTLSSIRDNTSVSHKITIVDDGSSKDSLKTLRSLKDVNLIEHGINRGPAETALTGFKNIKSRITVLMDNDVVVPENWLENILPYFKKKRMAIVAPLKFSNNYKYPDAKQTSREVWEKTKEKNFVPAEVLRLYTKNETLVNFGRKLVEYNALRDQEIIAPPGFVSGCCIAVNREFIVRAGGIAKSIFKSYGGEDVDLCWRVGGLGFEIIKTAKVYVHHFEHASITEGECNYQKTMEENNKLLYNLWGEKILSKETNLLKKMSAVKIKQYYPFISVFKKIKEEGKAKIF